MSDHESNENISIIEKIERSLEAEKIADEKAAKKA